MEFRMEKGVAMRDRITINHLRRQCERLNKITGQPPEPWIRNDDGRLVAQIGNYHLSQAYGGVALHQMVADGGAVRDVLSTGHCPKRELYYRMVAFIEGMATANGERPIVERIR